MDSPEVTFTLAYLVFAVCFVFTPTEFHSAGLTVQNLLSGWLGSEDAAFVPYHLRRTAATLLCHSLLPLGELAGRAAELGAGGGRWRPISRTPGGKRRGSARGPQSRGRGLSAPCEEEGAGRSCLLRAAEPWGRGCSGHWGRLGAVT